MSADEFRSLLHSPTPIPVARQAAFYEAWDEQWDEFVRETRSGEVGPASGMVGGA